MAVAAPVFIYAVRSRSSRTLCPLFLFALAGSPRAELRVFVTFKNKMRHQAVVEAAKMPHTDWEPASAKQWYDFLQIAADFVEPETWGVLGMLRASHAVCKLFALAINIPLKPERGLNSAAYKSEIRKNLRGVLARRAPTKTKSPPRR